jgi:hypothetical protein
MHLHFISPIDYKEFRNSSLASERLRLRYVEEAAKQNGYKITSGLSINDSADIFYLSKITKEIEEEILYVIQKIKKTKKIILVDYTDDILGSRSDNERKQIYEELMKINSLFIVPVEGLSNKLEHRGKKTFVIPDGIDNIPNINPSNKNNKEINVLWNGHSTNINSLIRVISKELVNYVFNLHIVSNAPSFKILNETKTQTIPKCKLIGHLWSINKLQQVSKNCDFAILPSDKIWASANRLVTNFRLGLPVIAESIKSYEPYSDYYCSFKKENISEIFRSQEKWYELVQKAQKKTQEDFSDEKLVSLWKSLFNNI